VTLVLETVQNSGCKDNALGFDFPEAIIAYHDNFFGYINNAFGVELGNSIQNIQSIHSDLSLRVRNAYECIIQKHIEPLFIELGFLGY